MRNLAVLTARLSGRPLFMREEDAHAWASRLLSADPVREERPKGFKGWLSRAKLMRQPEAAQQPHQAEAMADPRIGCASPLWMGEPDDAGSGWVLKDGVAVISVVGPMLDEGFYDWWSDTLVVGYDTLDQTFDEVQADPRVKGLFYRFKSPGGIASQGLPDLCNKMLAARLSAGGSKPIYCYADAAYSAAFWMFASCDRSYAAAISGVGSIGAVATHCDVSAMYAKDGIVMTPIKFGEKKVDGVSYQPLSPSAAADWQSEVDFLGNMFVDGVVAARPNLTREAVLATQAACFLAGNTDLTRSGFALGLVDEIAGEQVAFAALQAAIAGLEPSTNPFLAPFAPNPVRTAPHAQTETTMKPIKAATPENPVTEPADGNEICETCNGTGTNDGEECPDCDGAGQVEIDQGERTALTPPAPVQAATTAAADIAATAEAKANPTAALAAITAGLSVEQFKTMAAVSPSQASTEQPIDRRMRGAARLGADGAPAGDNKSSLGSALTADATAKRAKVTGK